jgi:hypothetical protein
MSANATPFDEAEAATKLGYPGERFESIRPYFIEGVYWVMIGSGDKKLGRPVIAKDGHIVLDKGYAAGMAWLRHVATIDNVETSVVPQVLRWYDALPIGWNEGHQFDPQTNEHSSVKLRPIEVKLVSSTYLKPWPRNAAPAPGGPSGPPPSSQPPGGGPTAGPPSGPPGGPGGPPGGYSPERPSRATLSEISGKLTWVIEAYDPGTRQWREELREAAE